MSFGVLRRGASIAYGLFTLSIFTVLATLDGSIFHRPTQKEKKQLAEAQDKFWNLDGKPFGVQHQFFRLRDGCKLHYVETAGLSKNRNLVIFIHGFPDSWVVWRNLLSSTRLLQEATLVGVDLPGYGGSDDLPDSGPENVLEALSEFILGMREQHLAEDAQNSRRVLIVGHDWGAIITCRLAAEASMLADRFIITSAVHPSLTLANAGNRFASAKQMLRTYMHNPTSLRLLRKAFSTIYPVLSQLRKSCYVFVFNLPLAVLTLSGRNGLDWFLRVLHRTAYRQESFLKDIQAAEAMAMFVGPSASECHPRQAPKVAASGEELGYPSSVAKRISSAGWPSKLRIYRDGLFLSNWSKSLETVFALSMLEQEEQRSRSTHSPHRPSTAGIFDSGPAGALLSQATIVYGMQDPAFESRLGLEGMSDYLVKGSQVVLLEEGGHWLPLETEGAQVLEEIIAWSLDGERESLRARLVENLERFGKSVRISVDT